MTTAKIAALQQIQGIQRFFKSPTVKDGSIPFFEADVQSACLPYQKTSHYTKYPPIELLTTGKIPMSSQHIADLWQESYDRPCLT